MFKKIGAAWYKLIGSSEDFSLEARIFHSITIGLVLLASVYAPYNLFAGLYVAGISAALFAAFFCFQYYYSRYHGKKHNSTVFALTGLFLFSINYFSNAGIDGSTDLIWPPYLLLVLAISPYRRHLLWIVTYIIAFLLIHLIEYNYPALVKYPFDLGKGKFIDRITAFPLPVISIAIIIIFIKKSYDRERIAADEKAATIELQKQQLQQSNAEKNKLLSIISHDMRAPFAHIQGYLSVLNQVEIGSAERVELEKELLDATDQTIEMLSNLLYWSRSQMEGVAVNLQQADLLTVLGNTLDISKAMAAKKSISLNYSIDDSITVVADANMLQLVIRNVVNNAIKFTHTGGIIDIQAKLSATQCTISVTDNGTGISPDKIATLFSMTSGSTFGTNNEKGVGLGLPLCKEFMDLQGGSITVKSTPGKGSVFYIAIPLGTKTV